MRTLLTSLVLAAVFVFPCTVPAGDIDGSAPLVCALLKVLECPEGEDCFERSTSDPSIPRIVTIDFAAKEIRSAPVGGPLRTTSFEEVQRAGESIILQGVQNNRAWSLLLDTTSGRMNISASDHQVVFVVFGTCSLK